VLVAEEGGSGLEDEFISVQELWTQQHAPYARERVAGVEHLRLSMLRPLHRLACRHVCLQTGQSVLRRYLVP